MQKSIFVTLLGIDETLYQNRCQHCIKQAIIKQKHAYVFQLMKCFCLYFAKNYLDIYVIMNYFCNREFVGISSETKLFYTGGLIFY